MHYKKTEQKEKKSQSGTFLGQLINIAIYNMDGNDKITFIGIIKLEFAKNKRRKTILRYHNGQNKRTSCIQVYLQTVHPSLLAAIS